MKKLFLSALLLVISVLGFAQQPAQTVEDTPEKTFSAVPQMRFYGFYPIHFGDQQFAKAYTANPGFGFNISPLRYKQLRLVLGFERTTYKVDDRSAIGQPVGRSSYQSLFASMSYTIGSEKKFCIKPTIGAGGSYFYLKVGSDRFSHQNAVDLRAGLTADWALAKHLSVFLTANYVHSNIDVDTASELRDFYSKANSIQAGFGLIIR